MKMVKRGFFAILIFYLVYIVGALIFGTITDFQPPTLTELDIENSNNKLTIQDSILKVGIWNIGYGGLGEESDFFYDDGSILYSGDGMIRASEGIVNKNVEGIQQLLKAVPVNFWLLQEVDKSSKRSYFTNEYEEVQRLLSSFTGTYAVNYRSRRVPIPILEFWQPYGKVESGLATFSAYQPNEAKRLQLPGEYGWPTRIFQLDRCALEHRYKLTNGKTLVVYNIHNSAYDSGGKLKAQQMAFLRALFLAEYKAGNYVIAGGDWNQCPPHFPANRFHPNAETDGLPINIDPTFMPSDWTWAYDPTTPTNRNVGDAYEKGQTLTTIIDFFLISPNLRLKSIKAIDHQFQFSDHQPVVLEVEVGR